MEDASQTPNSEKLWCNLKLNHCMNFRQQVPDLLERTDYPHEKERKIFARARNRISVESGQPTELTESRRRHRSPWWHIKIMTFANLGVSFNSTNSDLWLRQTDLSWHFPITRTIRDARTSQARQNRKDQETKGAENDDGQRYGNWQTSSTNDRGILLLARMEFGRNT